MPEPFRRKPPIPLREQRAAMTAAAAEETQDPEQIRMIWDAKKELVLLAEENKRIKSALGLIGQMEVSPTLRFEEVPGLAEAQELVDAFRESNPGKSTLDLLPIVGEQLDNALKTEIEGARREGLPVPNTQEALLIKKYLETQEDTRRILKGLDDLAQTPPPKTREAARAQHFMTRVPTDNPEFARAQANQRLRLKKAELKQNHILVPVDF